MDIIKDGKPYEIRLVSTDERELNDSYVTAFHYVIVADEPDLDDDVEPKRVRIGKIRAYYLDQEGGSVACPFGPNALIADADAIAQDTYEVACAFYGDQDTLFDLDSPHSTLYIAYAEVDPEWRGHDIGLFAAEVVIQAHGQGANIALIPSLGKRKLTKYWKRLDLQRFPVKGSGRILWRSGSHVRNGFKPPELTASAAK